MPTKPADRTSSVAHSPSDFESRLQALAAEATPLHAITAAGPWDSQRCATVLVRWLDAGLVVLLESTTTSDGTQLVAESRRLTYDQARTLLVDHQAWSPVAPDAVAEHLLCTGERALDLNDDAWWSAARAGDHHTRHGTAPLHRG